MGRSYWFECSKCGYRATVAGCADRGRDLFVQTVKCEDCKRLYDAVIRLRLPLEGKEATRGTPVSERLKAGPQMRRPVSPPTFMAVLNRLPVATAKRFTWLRFALQCPASSVHRVRPWNEPGKCPKCSIYMERNALPYRIWD